MPALAVAVATACYRRAAGWVRAAMPPGGVADAADVFRALQISAYRERGVPGLIGSWLSEFSSLVRVKRDMTLAAGARTGLFNGLAHDVRDAWRSARRAPGTPVVIVLTLALGIGMNTAVFSVVDALIFKALPYDGADRLVRVAEWPKSGGNYTAAPLAFLAWKSRVTTLDRLEARQSVSFVHLGADGPEEARGALVTPGYFSLLGVEPALGRTFDEADAAPGADCKVIVTHRLWTRRLNADPSLLNNLIPFAGRSCTLIGVLPGDTVFDRAAPQIYAPLIFTPALAATNGRFLTVMGRLAPGATLDSAQAELAGLAVSINAARGRVGEGWTVALTPWRDVVVRADSRTLAWTLFGAVSLVLLVACVNVAGLSLARAVQRRREWAVRLALGAGRWRAFRALVVEGLIWALVGEAVAIAIGRALLRALSSLLPPGTVPPETVASLDGRALLFASVVALTAALASATAPAWRGARADLADALRDGRGTAGSRAASRSHAALLVAEITLAMVLVTGASLLAVSFSRLTRVDPGFSSEGVITMSVSLPGSKYPLPSTQSAYFDRALDAVRRVPGVEHAAVVTSLPLGGWLFGTAFSILEQPAPDGPRPSAHIQTASDDYFATLGIPLMAGRDFSRRDAVDQPPVAIVNETFVRKFLGGGPALGRHILMDQPVGDRTGPQPPTAWEIVGVIRSVKTGGLAEKALAVPEIYVPFRQLPAPGLFVAALSASVPPSALAPLVKSALQSVDPQLPAGEALTMAERIGASVRIQRFRTGLLSGFAVLAVVLACVGVYGVRSRAVAARGRELGIRLAMGARPADITGLVIVESLKLVALGIAAGGAAAFAITRLFQQWLFETPTTDPSALVIAIVTLGGAAFVASWVPARRAGRVDPLTVLRND